MSPGRSTSLLRSSLLSGLTGAMLALAGPPLSSHWAAAIPAFLFAPLLGLLIRTETAWRAALLGLVAGLGFGAYSLRFAFDVLFRFAGLDALAALPVFLLLLVLQSAPLVLALGLARLADTPRSSRLFFTLPLALAASFGLVPMLFPWHLGHFTLPWLSWVQLAELGGLPLVDLVTSLVGCLLVAAVHADRDDRAAQTHATSPRGRRHTRDLVVSAALLAALVVGFGYARLATIRVERARASVLRVGVVQPDVSIAEVREGLTATERLTRLSTLSELASNRGANVVLWPEAAYPVPVSRARLLARDGGIRPLPSVGVPLVFGAMSTDTRDASGCSTWNTLIATSPSGVATGHVDKRHRFPFAEYIPFWSRSSWLQARYPCAGERVGEGAPLLTAAGTRLGALNCYEDVGPERTHEATRAGAELLLNFSNDAWFGRSVQPDLHRIVARFRAIEARRDLVRAVNTGASGHVAATGEELMVLPRHERGVFVADARRLTGSTLAVSLGDWVSPAALGILLVLLGLPLARRRRARQSLVARA